MAKATLYDQTIAGLRNNILVVVILIGVAAVAGTAAVLTNLKTIEGFFGNRDAIAFFNANVQPIYFKGRTKEFEEGQFEHLEAIVAEIKRLDPKAIYLHSHTSRLAPGANEGVGKTRGQYIKLYMTEFAELPDDRIFVITHGGSDSTPEAEATGYAQRVIVELSNTLVKF